MRSGGDFGSYCFISDVKRVIKFEPSFSCDKNEISSRFLPKYFPIEKLGFPNKYLPLGGKLSIISALDTCAVPIFINLASPKPQVKYNKIPAELLVERNIFANCEMFEYCSFQQAMDSPSPQPYEY